ncbi:MAG: glycine cleavage system aminomethyltransferase GcvT [Planctomycetota bacterium]
MKQTPIHSFHVENGGQLVDYTGWALPLRYTSIIEEHNQVRASGGIFDVSHMGRLRFKGLHAKRLLERACTRRVGTMQPGQCRYTLICNDRGGVRDDALVYKFDDDSWYMVCNGANRQKIVDHLASIKADRDLKVDIADETEKTAMIAAQGPKIVDLVSTVSKEIPALKKYRFTEKNLVIAKLLVSRTGYTGEDGFEVIMPKGVVGIAMKMLLKEIDPKDPDAPVKPAGLGARDTLRIEAGMPLYGQEFGEDISALAAGFGFAMNLDKSEEADGETFVGQEALVKEQEAGGPARILAGLEIDSKRTARPHMKVLVGGSEAGEVTSGCASPTLGKSIAMAYLDRAHTVPGTAVEIDFGKQTIGAKVVQLPFYKAPK